MAEAPLFFHISPDHCGEADLAKLFQVNGLNAVCYEKGELAEDLFWSKATDGVPFASWPKARLLTGLYRYKPSWRPPLEGWRQFAFIDRLFPNAQFILTKRDTDGWLFDRLTADKGLMASSYKAHLDVDDLTLAEIWEQDWLSHVKAVNDYFKDSPRLIQVDMASETPLDLGERIKALLGLDEISGPRRWEKTKQHDGLLDILDDTPDAASPDEPAFAKDVAGFCLRGIEPHPEGGLRGVSDWFCLWDGDTKFVDPNGTPHPLKLVQTSGQGPDYVLSPAGPFTKGHRTEAVINDFLRLDRRMEVAIDMQDARWCGRQEAQPLCRPIIAYNRREGASNMVLWPLHEMHGPGNPGFTVGTTDKIPFDEKRDEIVWRGMISGFEALEGDKKGVSSMVSLRQLEEAGDDQDAREEAWQNLCRTSRMSVIRQWFGKPGFDLAIVMAWAFRRFAQDSLLAPYCDTRRALPFFHKFRYQLSLAGHDTGSNFIPMINSQSVLLKEEDGWEVYYSGRFKPWRHYIPLERNCGDLADKLDWARHHPKECKEMSLLAREEVARFANPHLHRKIKEHILDGLIAEKGKT